MGRFNRREREDKSVLTQPRCPYCKNMFSPPKEISTQLAFFDGGVCECGAVYVFDPSHKNMGEAFMDALSYACKEDWELVLSFEENVDYEQVSLTYISHNHTVSSKIIGNNPFEKSGNMVFVKLKNKIQY